MSGPLPSTQAQIEAMFGRVDRPLLTQIVHLTGNAWRAKTFPIHDYAAAASHAATIDAAGYNAYIRTTAMTEPPAPGKRGGAALTGAVTDLFIDLDVAGPGHSDKQVRLPTDVEALELVDTIGIQPSMMIATGGGYHLHYLLAEPFYTDTPERIGQAAELGKAWNNMFAAHGAAHGFHVDRVGDLARVGRLSGTHRRKPGVPVNQVYLAAVAGWPTSMLGDEPWLPTGYSIEQVRHIIATGPSVPTAPPPPRRAPTGHDRTGIGPADILARLSWSQILGPHGWTVTGHDTIDGKPVELWLRPGDASSKYSIKCFSDGPAVVWSSAAGLPVGPGQRLNKWRVFAWLEHGGDESAAARAVRYASRAGHGRKAAL